VWEQDHDEYLKYFPEDEQYIRPYIEAYQNMLIKIDNGYNSVKSLIIGTGKIDRNARKEVASRIKDLPEAFAIFKLIEGKSLSDVLERVLDKHKSDILKKFMNNNQ
jgi:hypothetical protein